MKSKGRVLFIIHDLYQEDIHFPLGVAYLAANYYWFHQSDY
jgi:hypothetical protein